MAGRNDNLRPVRTHEEAVERGRKGGKAKGEAHKKRMKLKEELLLLLSSGDTQKNISVALIQEALEGNIRAFEVIRDTIGENPTQKVEASQSVTINVGIDED